MNFPPQPYGECSLCKRHHCGEYEEDGKKTQTWLHFPIELDRGGNLVIGYQCIDTMSKDAGIGLKVVEKVLQMPPTDEQIKEFGKSIIEKLIPLQGDLPIANIGSFYVTDKQEKPPCPSFETMKKNEIYNWLIAHKVDVDWKELNTLPKLKEFAIEKYNEMYGDAS